MILERVPQVLQNKALILSKDASDIDYFAATLCSLVSVTAYRFVVLGYLFQIQTLVIFMLQWYLLL